MKQEFKMISKNAWLRFKFWLLKKDIPYNSEKIGYFLYEVLYYINKNTSMDLQDISSLVYRDYQIRNNCVYYIYSYICPDEPKYLESMKKILNNYVETILRCLGINGLQSSYLGKPSVYIDRVVFKDCTVYLRLLYIYNDDSLRYYNSETKREQKNSNNTIKAVYDDEV